MLIIVIIGAMIGTILGRLAYDIIRLLWKKFRA